RTPNEAFHLTGPAHVRIEASRSLQPARQVNSCVRPPPLLETAVPRREAVSSCGIRPSRSPQQVTVPLSKWIVRRDGAAPVARRSRVQSGGGRSGGRTPIVQSPTARSGGRTRRCSHRPRLLSTRGASASARPVTELWAFGGQKGNH